MRCDNCGWPNNAAGRSTCEKCSASLRNGSPQPHSPQSPPQPRVGQPENSPFQKTVQGRKAEMPSWDAPAYQPPSPVPILAASQMKRNCEHCGYPNHKDAIQCINNDCGKPFTALPNSIPVSVPSRQQQSPPPKPITGTVDPYRTGTSTIFSLKPIARAKEIALPQQPLVFNTGDKVTLNRDNVDPGNFTITGKAQATVVLIEGKWHLVDNSSQQTSFVLAKEPIALQKGDIILLGDRKFEFDC